ncbi:DUF6461 domain-containing protein [Streptomyces sp. NPDC047869]|uniref:DUF6461 domain-containing protein n=1 Tax=Streptomyces sp. NPDC047869 TaxID=3154709 RepID=UPI00345711B5
MSDGIVWISRTDITWLGYCVVLVRGIGPEELVRRLAQGADPVFLGPYTRGDLEDYVNDVDREWHPRGATSCVRYGAVGDLAFAVAAGDWTGGLGPGYTGDISQDGAHVFWLRHETENPTIPAPVFTYQHDGRYVCGFEMAVRDSAEITGTHPELVRDRVLAAGIAGEEDRDVAEEKSLAIVQELFGLTLPREEVLHGALPAALVKGRMIG